MARSIPKAKGFLKGFLFSSPSLSETVLKTWLLQIGSKLLPWLSCFHKWLQSPHTSETSLGDKNFLWGFFFFFNTYLGKAVQSVNHIFRMVRNCSRVLSGL